ncbi:MAG: hypothetical protein EOO38_16600 [Cytophagaceae bacterium]|nr:MAG: hypothetical protein EOO38_16600 [Cytophagaceae bacterium]
MMNFLLLLGFCSLLCMATFSAKAQTKVISGTVTDVADGSPLSGVTVADNAKSSSTSTNAQGKYTLSIPANAKTITFSYIGYQPKTLPVTNANTINVVMSSSSNTLQDVVVVSVGYGTIDKREVSSAITHISSGWSAVCGLLVAIGVVFL